jgi:hypothetical protein
MLPDFYLQPFGCFLKTQTTIKFKSNSTQKFPQSLQEKRETTQYQLPNRNTGIPKFILYPFSCLIEKTREPKEKSAFTHLAIIRNSPRKFLSKTTTKNSSTHLVP